MTLKLLVIGGQLQGTEITYLAKEAGWEVTVVDRNAGVLASRLCDHFICSDILAMDYEFFQGFDLIFPATESIDTLLSVKHLVEKAGTPFVFDEQAYLLSRSKQKTNQFLREIGVSIPPLIDDRLENNEYERLGYIAKPDSSSGSKGVQVFAERSAALSFIQDHEGFFGQVFLEGPIYSIEVVCDEDNVTPCLVTEVVMDSDYDCHQVVAPADIAQELMDEIVIIAQRIGHALQMRGLFDIELVLHDSSFYVLEIDARMPSQTPIAVYHASGVNLVEMAAQCFYDVSQPGSSSTNDKKAHAILQHVRVEQGETGAIIHLIGEGRLTEAPPLCRTDGFCGTDAALVSENMERGCTYATLIAIDVSNKAAADKMSSILAELASTE